MSLTEEQIAKLNERGGRPSKAFLASLKPAGKAAYAELEKAVVQALVAGAGYVVLVVPNVFSAPPEWGSKKVLTRTKTTLKVQYNAARILAWLNENGHSEITSRDIRAAKIRFTINNGDFIDTLESL